MPQSSEDRDGIPKIEDVVASQPISRPKTLQLLSQFLVEEQERRRKLREDHGLNSTWKDLQTAYDTLSLPYDPHVAGGASPGMGGLDGDGGDASGGVGDWSKRLVSAAASSASSFMGSPDQAALKDKKARKERKKKRKDAKKEAKKQAKLQLKNKMGNSRF